MCKGLVSILDNNPIILVGECAGGRLLGGTFVMSK